MVNILSMQRVFTLFFILFCSIYSFAQIRYKDELFTIKKNADIQYGSNYDNKNQLTNLLMDVYEPLVDTATVRPLIIFVHGGSFVGGDRTDQQINRTAEFFAKKGYVTANIEYRVEQTILIDPIINFADSYNWHRAIARATQDLKAAIRYFKKDVVINGNRYKVDTSKIFLYGSSAGAITALHTIYLDDTLEMTGVTKASYSNVGGLDGNSGNDGYSSKSGVKAIVSCSGALESLNCMNNNSDIDLLLFHNNPDLTVPFNIGCFVTVACWLGQYYGSNQLYPKANALGAYTEYYPFNYYGHPVDQANDTTAHRIILQKTTDFLYRIAQPEIPTLIRNNTNILSLDIYPNPTDGNFTISIPNTLQQQEVEINIMDITGKIVYTEKSSNKAIVPINTTLPKGMYAVSIIANNQQSIGKISVVK